MCLFEIVLRQRQIGGVIIYSHVATIERSFFREKQSKIYKFQF